LHRDSAARSRLSAALVTCAVALLGGCGQRAALVDEADYYMGLRQHPIWACGFREVPGYITVSVGAELSACGWQQVARWPKMSLADVIRQLRTPVDWTSVFAVVVSSGSPERGTSKVELDLDASDERLQKPELIDVSTATTIGILHRPVEDALRSESYAYVCGGAQSGIHEWTGSEVGQGVRAALSGMAVGLVAFTRPEGRVCDVYARSAKEMLAMSANERRASEFAVILEASAFEARDRIWLCGELEQPRDLQLRESSPSWWPRVAARPLAEASMSNPYRMSRTAGGFSIGLDSQPVAAGQALLWLPARDRCTSFEFHGIEQTGCECQSESRERRRNSQKGLLSGEDGRDDAERDSTPTSAPSTTSLRWG
jgi:hypothetical protein